MNWLLLKIILEYCIIGLSQTKIDSVYQSLSTFWCENQVSISKSNYYLLIADTIITNAAEKKYREEEKMKTIHYI